MSEPPTKSASRARLEGERIADDPSAMFEVRDLCAWFGQSRVLSGVSLAIARHRVTALIGPSGCGKSTLLRCLNRMHEMKDEAALEGRVALERQDIYDVSVDPVLLRRRVGMVFPRPNPFPGMSIRGNVVAGLKLAGRLDRSRAYELCERALQQASLWDEVKDRLDQRAASLSDGHQQQLCIARALAVGPSVLLMDEPCSSLDPIATARIEELIHRLRERYTIVIATHNTQAARISDHAAFFVGGQLVEYGETDRLFTSPRDKRTEDYLTGRFG